MLFLRWWHQGGPDNFMAMLYSSVQAAAGMGQTLWLCQSRDKRGSWLPGGAKGPLWGPPLHRATCKATCMLQGCRDQSSQPGGTLDLLCLWSSSALGAVSPEEKPGFPTVLPFRWALAPAQPHLYPNLQIRPCPRSVPPPHRAVQTRHRQLPQPHTLPKIFTWVTEVFLWCQCSRGHQQGLREETSSH